MSAPARGPDLLARVRRFLASSDEIDAARARTDAVRAGYDCVADVGDRRKVHLTGFISSMVVHPRSAAPTVEVDVVDGTGSITVIWVGREEIPGIEPGTRLSVTGFAANRGNHRVMYNPRYEILARAGEEQT
ncbi:OB-fold nucleic acid binding domain-containing protein [Brachybacterium sp. AOP25-B2-12]|uniref:OB-fold nucleic acid binding domain-containing protein n=1 Tax=Brachybacterium sp. AOP25-B2-12 TaxID=3457710 RepID=UPI0040342BA8